MNELGLPASKSVFPFWISGTILITPSPRLTPTRAPRITLVVDVGVAVHLLFFAPVEVCNHGILGQFLAVRQSRTTPLSGSPKSSVAGSIRSTKSNGSSASNRSATAPVDTKYTGHILISNYHISYVLPKVFPVRYPDSDGYSPASGSLRRSPIVERNTVQLLAAIDMFVPYASRPPRSPYVVCLLSTPLRQWYAC
jgi:hypothetical protein